MKTVWIYVDTSKKVGDVDHLRVFANVGVANRWFEKNDPAGVAFRYEVRKAATVPTLEKRVPSGKKKTVSNGELTTIFFRVMRSYSECPYSGTPIAVVPFGRGTEWKALIAPYVVRRHPLCAKRVEEVEKELQKLYSLERE